MFQDVRWLTFNLTRLSSHYGESQAEAGRGEDSIHLLGFHSLASLCACAICSGVICAATVSRSLAASVSDSAGPREPQETQGVSVGPRSSSRSSRQPRRARVRQGYATPATRWATRVEMGPLFHLFAKC
jgi:hypothetical protein